MPALPYTIGVLALQGAFIEHINLINKLKIPKSQLVLGEGENKEEVVIVTLAVRTKEDLERCDALVIPGGESTSIASIATRSGLLEPLRAFCQDPQKPCLGTCAGMILLADKAEGAKKGGQELFGGMTTNVLRNGFGSQLESFESPLILSPLLNTFQPPPPASSSSSDGEKDPLPPFNGIFIRAPMLLPSPSSNLQILAHLPFQPTPDNPSSSIVAFLEGKKMAISFHPELTAGVPGGGRFHEFFVRGVCLGGKGVGKTTE